MTSNNDEFDPESLDSSSPLRRIVATDVLDAVKNRLTPLSGKPAHSAKWLPPVLRERDLTYTYALNSDYVAVFVERSAISRRNSQSWGKLGVDEFPGLFTRYPQKALFRVAGSSTMFGAMTLDGGGLFIAPDGSAVINDVGIKGRTAHGAEIQYTVSLAYVLGFGSKIRALSVGSHMDALVAYSLKAWREHAAS